MRGNGADSVRAVAVLAVLVMFGLVACGGGDGGDGGDGPPGVAGDTIVEYQSDPLSDYAKLGWEFPAGAIPRAGVAPWLHARVSALVTVPGVVPPLDPPVPFSHSGLGGAQQVRATFNLTTGAGTVTLLSLDGRCTVRLTGADGAFKVVETSTVASLTSIFSAGELAETPFLIMNTDRSLVTVDEWTVDRMDYSAGMGGVGASFGVFFPYDPNDAPAALPPWAEKWCLIVNAENTDQELQEY